MVPMFSFPRYLGIDETDRMGEKGHFEELTKLLEKLREERDEEATARQIFVMSATLSLVHKAPSYNKGISGIYIFLNKLGESVEEKRKKALLKVLIFPNKNIYKSADNELWYNCKD